MREREGEAGKQSGGEGERERDKRKEGERETRQNG